MVLLACLACLLAACAPSAQRPPAIPIAFEAQDRLLQDARSLVSDREFQSAARLLTRLIATYPHSTLLSEARWLLAGCYEHTGQFHRALEQYELLTHGSDAPYTAAAARRITELRPRVPSHALASGLTNGWLVTTDALTTDQQLQRLAAAGISLAVIPIGSSDGVYFPTTLAPVIGESVSRLATAAHRHGILVYGAVSVDQMAWVSRTLGWHDLRYDSILRRLQPSAYLDLFNPAFQEFLTAFVSDLAHSGVDGLLFRSAPTRLDDGLSTFATEAFRQEFHVTLNPAALWMPVRRSRNDQTSANPADLGEPAPVFWQWVGWKARHRAKLLDRLMEASRRTVPALRFAVELHPESVMEPVRALAQFGEEVLAIKQTPADFFFFRFTPTSSRSNHSSAPMAADLTRSFLQRTGELLGGLERVWIVSGSSSAGTLSLGSLDPIADRVGLPQEIGLIYEGRLVEGTSLP